KVVNVIRNASMNGAIFGESLAIPDISAKTAADLSLRPGSSARVRGPMLVLQIHLNGSNNSLNGPCRGTEICCRQKPEWEGQRHEVSICNGGVSDGPGRVRALPGLGPRSGWLRREPDNGRRFWRDRRLSRCWLLLEPQRRVAKRKCNWRNGSRGQRHLGFCCPKRHKQFGCARCKYKWGASSRTGAHASEWPGTSSSRSSARSTAGPEFSGHSRARAGSAACPC